MTRPLAPSCSAVVAWRQEKGVIICVYNMKHVMLIPFVKVRVPSQTYKCCMFVKNIYEIRLIDDQLPKRKSKLCKFL